jgi:oligoendopeptidase F
MYPEKTLLLAEFNKVDTLIEKISAYKGQLMVSATHLYEALSLQLDIARVIENVATYSKMKLDEDSRVSDNQAMSSRAESLGVKVQEALSFIIPEILASDEKLVMTYMEQHEGLKVYAQMIDDILRRKPHTLSSKEEQILAMAGDLASTPYNTFEMLDSADFIFPTIKGEKGEDIQLTHGSFIPTMESKDRRVRKDAYDAFYSVYKGHINGMAALMQAEVKKNSFFARAKNFSTAREASLFENNVPVSVYDQLIESVNKNLPAMHKYMGIRKRLLGVDTLKMYDVYVPIIQSVEMKFPYEEAQKLVLESLAPLGNQYVETVKKAYEDRWIDVYENTGKRSGAYSWGTYDSKPYILLNYHDNIDNMFTLTHEMGHSMHSHFTHVNQPYVYGNYSIFLAEVASTTNEALLNHYMLENAKNKEEKLLLLNHYLEQFRGTVFRQTMFAEFERDMHKIVEDGGALTAEVLKANYRTLNEKYYGPEMEIDDTIAVEWARIPHFYYNFYVFQYATGFSAAVALAEAIVNEGQPAVDRYLNFLSAGNHQYPIDILKAAGADMASGKPVDDCLALFSRLVDEFDELSR